MAEDDDPMGLLALIDDDTYELHPCDPGPCVVVKAADPRCALARCVHCGMLYSENL